MGKGGQLAVMSHIVTRGLNVAIPEIDVGSDIFVVHDDKNDLWPVQVKTATARKLKDGDLSAKFYLKVDQLRTVLTPERLVYSLVFFHDGRWAAFLNVPRKDLDNATAGMSPNKDRAITPTLRLTATQAKCGETGVDLERFREWWDYWPDLRPGAPIRPQGGSGSV